MTNRLGLVLRLFPTALLTVLAGGVLGRPGHGQCELVDVGPSSGDIAFGAAVSADGDRVAVGAPGDTNVPGAVYVFEADEQNAFLDSRLTLIAPAAGVEYGAAVALSGTTLFVGAPDENLSGFVAGAVYVYELSGGTWGQAQVLQPADLPPLAEFGRSLDFDGERLVVGARFDSSTQPLAGSAYVFEDAGGLWTQTAKLSAQLPSEEQNFGASVAIDDEWIFCGAPGDDQRGTGAGAVFVFERQGSTWTPTQKLLGSDTDTGDQFGTALDVQGDVVMIGSPKEETNPNEDDGGGVYCFDRAGNVWSQCQLLFSASSGTGDQFGYSVALRSSQDVVVIGAPTEDSQGVSAGTAYVFELSGTVFVQAAELTRADAAVGAADGECFGEAVSVSGDQVLVGALSGDPLDVAAVGGTQAQGAAYLYSLTESTCSTLSANRLDVSLSSGGFQTLTLQPGPSFAGQLYVVAGSAAGRDPGLTALGRRVPLNPDTYLLQTLSAPSPPLTGSFGMLDGGGLGTTTFTLPPNSDPALVGLVVHHAFVVLGGGIVHVSRPQGVLLTL